MQRPRGQRTHRAEPGRDPIGHRGQGGRVGTAGRVAELYPQSNVRTLKGFGILGKIEPKLNFKELAVSALWKTD